MKASIIVRSIKHWQSWNCVTKCTIYSTRITMTNQLKLLRKWWIIYRQVASKTYLTTILLTGVISSQKLWKLKQNRQKTFYLGQSRKKFKSLHWKNCHTSHLIIHWFRQRAEKMQTLYRFFSRRKIINWFYSW